MNDSDSGSVQKSKAPLYISILLVAAVVGSYFIFPEVKDFLDNAWKVLTSGDEEKITNWVDQFGWFGPIVIVITMILQMFLIVIPTIVLMVVTILAYGPIWGSLLVLLSIFLASTTGFFIGKYFGTFMVTKLIGKKSADKVGDFLEDYGFWAVFITRVNPFLSNDAISLVAGILSMNYWKFISATLAGIAPLTLFIAVLGRSTTQLEMGLLYGSLVSLIIFGLYIWWDRKKRSKD